MDTRQAELALGRILRLASRPEQASDAAEYERCRRIILDTLPTAGDDPRPTWVRDRLRGAAGD